MLTRKEFLHHADIAAAHKFGEENAGWFVFRRWLAGPLGVLALVAAAGAGAWWLWTRIAAAFRTGGGAVPMFFWVLLVFLLLATAVAFRPRVIPHGPFVVFLKAVGLGLGYLGLMAYGVGTWLS